MIMNSFVSALTITGTNSVYQVGETSEIRCSTEVPVQSIQWLDESSGVVRQGTSVQELVLDLTIAASHSNSRYTCRVSQGTFIGERMITINIMRKKIVCPFLVSCTLYGVTISAIIISPTSFLHSTDIVSTDNNKRETSGGRKIHSNMCC